MTRRRFRVRGVVQGVGFRPFVYGLAHRHGLAGFVLNDGDGVVVEAEGPAAALDRFARALVHEAPSLARVADVRAEAAAPLGESEFRIVASEGAGRGSGARPARAAVRARGRDRTPRSPPGRIMPPPNRKAASRESVATDVVLASRLR